ncbi:hypothetical protein J4H86_00140 [Spiractinospora alimapuensis]|uniref:hypothetical protein n=1 Tax=Spiractinospora alimapuensis TaxID=2820884 RepID=UPI001F379DFC|nr:hypothetical protein [Spiractinospora alimapuensis]QVQ52325.1 hypothetical protein J4H86_00140 [Spiractinospora alimapuensis]
MRRSRESTPTTIDVEAVGVVAGAMDASVAVTAPGGVRLLSIETTTRLEDLDEDDVCASLGWLAVLFTLGLDFGTVSVVLAELEFTALAGSGLTGEVLVELRSRVADDGMELSDEDLATQLRLLGVHACERRGRVQACVCLADFSAEELHAQIVRRRAGGGRRP